MKITIEVMFVAILQMFCALLVALDRTGLAMHIVIAVLGILVLGAYTAATKKTWKIPALEIIMRVCYGIALITGIVIMNVHGIVALAIIHKVSAVLFLALQIVLLTYKAFSKKKA